MNLCISPREHRVKMFSVPPGILIQNLMAENGRVTTPRIDLPADVQIVGVLQDEESDAIVILMHSLTWPVVPEGGKIPNLTKNAKWRTRKIA